MPPSESHPLRVLVVAGDPLARAGLATLLGEQAGLEVVGQVSPSAELAADLELFEPDVIAWDLGWDPSSSIGHLRELRVEAPVLALLPGDERAMEVWSAGARGLLLRDADGPGLAAAARALAQGHVVLAPDLAAAILPSGDRQPDRLVEDLTPREREVLALMAEGLANKEIAGRLGVSGHTIKFHVNAILAKLGAQSRTEAVVRATRMGLVLL